MLVIRVRWTAWWWKKGRVYRWLITNQRRAAPPGDLSGDSTIPKPYLAQMADYRAVLRAIFPDHEIRCALLFTDVPALIWLGDAALDSYAP